MERLSALGAGPVIGRIVIPFLAFAITVTILFPEIFSFGETLKKPFLIAGIILLAIGLVFYISTAKTLLTGIKNTRLMTTGTFSLCQNPLYFGMIVLIIPGLALALNSWVLLIDSFLGYFLFKQCIHTEYEEMEKFFGEDYRKYGENTPEFFPFTKRNKKIKA